MSDVTSAEPGGYEGRVQGVGDGHVLGWVWNPGRHEERVAVTVLIDGEQTAEGVADCQRDDLSSLGIGDGAHGFLIRLPDELGGPGRLEVAVAAGAERICVPPSPSFWQEAPQDSHWSATKFVPGTRLPGVVGRLPARPEVESVSIGGWRFAARGRESAPSRVAVVGALGRLAAVVTPLYALGMAVVVGCLPSKASVLGEEQAGDLASRSAWLTAMAQAQHDLDHIEVFDLLPALQAARRHGSPYDPEALDLNGRGTFFVVRALLKEASKRCPSIAAAPLSMLHLAEDRAGALVPDPNKRLALRMPPEDHLVTGGEMHVRLYVREDFGSDLRLALVGDQGSLNLLPWLAECASRTTYFCARTPPMPQIELEMPDVVLLMLDEATLDELSDGDPGPMESVNSGGRPPEVRPSDPALREA